MFGIFFFMIIFCYVMYKFQGLFFVCSVFFKFQFVVMVILDFGFVFEYVYLIWLIRVRISGVRLFRLYYINEIDGYFFWLRIGFFEVF